MNLTFRMGLGSPKNFWTGFLSFLVTLNCSSHIHSLGLCLQAIHLDGKQRQLVCCTCPDSNFNFIILRSASHGYGERAQIFHPGWTCDWSAQLASCFPREPLDSTGGEMLYPGLLPEHGQKSHTCDKSVLSRSSPVTEYNFNSGSIHHSILLLKSW